MNELDRYRGLRLIRQAAGHLARAKRLGAVTAVVRPGACSGGYSKAAT